MDIATLVGIIGTLTVIIGAIITGGSAMVFINVPSILIVVVGTLTATLIKFSLAQFLGSMKVAAVAFMHKPVEPKDLIAEAVMLAGVARKEGLLALEGREVSNPFLAKGIQLLADGQEPAFVQKILSRDINLAIDRHTIGESIFRGMGDTAPAMGMIGTLVGLVQMLSNMDDPKSIGPAMAVALLTTLYGAVIANAVALPMAEKLKLRSNEEKMNRSLILEIIISIQEGVNPRVIEELLKTYLPDGGRKAEDEPEGGA